MKVLDSLKNNLRDWTRLELVFFPLSILFIICVSLFKNDSIIALLASVCGVTYTIFAGKGRILCYIFGIIATLCYSYCAYKSAFWGNFALNIFYYLPASFIGVFLWKKHLKKDKNEIIKTKLSPKSRILLFSLTLIFTIFMFFYLQKIKDSSPFFDSFTTIFSILGMFLTVKRCIEQWYVWFFVNILSAIMWFSAYLNGIDCLSIVFKWLIYAVLAVYFYFKWEKEV